MSNKIIEVYINKETSQHDCGCNCSCNCDCGTNDCMSLEELERRFTNKYGDRFEFRAHVLSNNNKAEFVSKLNHVLKNSNEQIIINKLNISYLLYRLLPIIAVDGMIVSVKNYPTEEELIEAIESGKRIPTKPSCC